MNNIRLNFILEKIISENQSDFIKDKQITENILLAQELSKGVSHSNHGDNLIIKLDMTKAFDRMS